MIQSLNDSATEHIFNGINSKRARQKLDPMLHRLAQRKLDMLDAASILKDFEVPSANRLEKLRGNLQEK